MSRWGIAGVALAAALAVQPAAALERGGALTTGVSATPVTCNPRFMGSFFEIGSQYLLHEPLLSITADLRIEPGMASVQVVDALTCAFTLRDGTPLDAAAAKGNVDRMLEPGVGSPRRSDLGPVEAVEVTGPLTLTVRFSQPYAPFLHVMTNRGGIMVSPTAAQTPGQDFTTQAVGDGPFRVVSWTEGSERVHKRVDGCWRRGAPLLETVAVRPIEDETVRLANLQSGAVQLIDTVPPQSFARLKSAGTLKTYAAGGAGFNAFSLNLTRQPVHDMRVRRALMQAVDPKVIQRAVSFEAGSVAAGPAQEAQARIAADAPMPFMHVDAALQASAPNVAFDRDADGSFRLHGGEFTKERADPGRRREARIASGGDAMPDAATGYHDIGGRGSGPAVRDETPMAHWRRESEAIGAPMGSGRHGYLTLDKLRRVFETFGEPLYDRGFHERRTESMVWLRVEDGAITRAELDASVAASRASRRAA